MANAMIFYRTPTTLQSNPTYDTPAKLLALKPDQCLLFTPPDNLAAKLDEDYTNNIVRKIPPNPAGRRINQTDEGVAGWIVNIEGNFLAGTVGADTKIHAFRVLPQSDSVHEFGIFGILWPNGPTYLQSIDPSPTKGFMIERSRGAHIGITKEIVDFGIAFSYGGDVS